jgi:hypothetical protein
MKLKLVLKYKWFDMIESLIKKEEYRSIKPSIISKLFDLKKADKTAIEFMDLLIKNPTDISLWKYLKPFESIVFYRAYSRGRKEINLSILSITVGKAVPEWSDNWPGDVFVLKLGNIISTKNT